ncbi:MAG: NAD-dependent SIR2 family protein deacetylase [Parasphingorhabdus sp.]
MGSGLSSPELLDFFQKHSPVAVLTGAGCSTASGIPDYRDKNGDWKQRQPIQYRAFVDEESSRQRYWLRSMLGWPYFSNATPNNVHADLVVLEQTGLINGVITQNVDGLHRQVGQAGLIELHGQLHNVRCLKCDQVFPRQSFQSTLEQVNRSLLDQIKDQTIAMAADGDAHYEPDNFTDASIPECTNCGGILKPDVVFFGEAVPAVRVEHSFELIDQAKALLVLGSSLMVFSGFRFPRHAHRNNYPLAIINQGVTRADDLADIKIDQECGAVMAALREELTGKAA